MIDTDLMQDHIRNANPIPHVDDLDADELAVFVAAAHSTRSAFMEAPSQQPTRTTASPETGHRHLWAFAAGFIAVLLVIGATTLVLRGGDTPVADEPAPPPTPAETPMEPILVESLVWSRIPYDGAVLGGEGIQAMGSVTVGGPGLVAVGDDHGRAAVWTSPDGYAWSRVPHDESIFGTDAEHWEMHSVTAGGPGFVAVGAQMPTFEPLSRHAALVWTSPDGLTWGPVPHHAALDDALMWDVTAGGPGVVAVGAVSLAESHGTPAVWTSPDGITWSQASVPYTQVEGVEQSTVMTSVTVGGPGLVAVGRHQQAAAVWTSPDGLTWMRVPHNEAVFGGDGIQAMGSVTVGGPGLVAVGDDHGRAAVWTSADGYSWSRVPHDETIFGAEIRPEYAPHTPWDYYDNEHPMSDVIATTSGLVAVGREPNLPQAVVWTSSDGISWSRVPYEESVFGRGDQTPRHTDPSSGMRIHSVTAVGPGLVAVGEDDLAGIAAVWAAAPTDADETATPTTVTESEVPTTVGVNQSTPDATNSESLMIGIDPDAFLDAWQQVAVGDAWVRSVVDVEGLPDGGFVAVTRKSDPWRVMWSPDGVEWHDADPQRQMPRIADWAGTDKSRSVEVTADQVVVLDHANVGVWVGDPQTGQWEPIRLDTSGFDGRWGTMALAANDSEALIVATREDLADGDEEPSMSQVMVWLVDISERTSTRTSLPATLVFSGALVEWLDDRWIMLSDDVTGRDGCWVWMSSDGGSWTESSLPEGLNEGCGGSLTAGPSGVIMTRSSWGGDDILYSPDGLEWELVYDRSAVAKATYSETLGYVVEVTVDYDPESQDERPAGDSHIVDAILTSTDGDAIMVSADGRTWHLAGPALPAYGMDFLLAASDGSLLVRDDLFRLWLWTM